MQKILSTIFPVFFVLTAAAQNAMRPVDQLINTAEPGWKLVNEWIGEASNSVEVLPRDSVKAAEALYKTQVTTRSPMGAIIYETGGLLIDSGWLRILGSGSSKLERSLPHWNRGKSFREFGEQPSILLVADDAAGGFFAINGGALGSDAGKIYYLSPNSITWDPLNLNYSEFLRFCFTGDLAGFYKDLRWKAWKEDVAGIGASTVYSFFPYLWTKEGSDVNTVQRKPVPIEEQFNFIMNMRKQLGLLKNGL